MTRQIRKFSEAELEEIWRRWRAGESISGIARALNRKLGSIHSLLASKGGIAPALRRRSATALTFAEREEISRGLASEMSFRAIAELLGRSPSTISREVNQHGGRSGYRAARAEETARKRSRRPKTSRLSTNAKLRRVTATKLSEDWSPEQIAGWLRLEHPDDPSMWISHESIYRALYCREDGPLGRDAVRRLRSRRTMRRSRSSTRKGQACGHLVGTLSIRERLSGAEGRAELGHWEGDLMSGSNNTHIATLVDRASRATVLVRVKSKDAATVRMSLTRALKRLPARLRRSLTWDRGSELAEHAKLSRATGMPIYFCDPQSPWQRGTNENTNGLLRQYFPKGTPLSGVSQATLNALARQLNRRPRKVLGFNSPRDILAAVALTL
jgi:IS30 family transposase